MVPLSWTLEACWLAKMTELLDAIGSMSLVRDMWRR